MVDFVGIIVVVNITYLTVLFFILNNLTILEIGCMSDLIKENQIFGYWKVLGESKENPLSDDVKYYRCRCACGKEKDIRAESLINKLSTSCGCRRQKNRKELFVGTKFGSWQIVNSTFNSNKNDMYYYCECSRCEAKIEGYHSELYRKMKDTCHCNIGTDGFRKGSRYGNWTIVGSSEKSATKSNDRYYLCQCDCGKMREVLDSSLRKMLSTSCGCSRINSQKKVISLIGRPNPQSFLSDNYGNWRVIKKDIAKEKKIYECTKCSIKIEVKLGATHRKCPICSHPNKIDTKKLILDICKNHNLIFNEDLYFEFCSLTKVDNFKYTITNGTLKFSGIQYVMRNEKKHKKIIKGHPLKNSPVISSVLSNLIDDLKSIYDEQYIIQNKNDLHPLLVDLNEWDLTKILLQGYFIEDPLKESY